MIQKLQKFTAQFIKQAFDTLRLNLLGPSHFSKALTFSVKKFDPHTTIAANYMAANALNAADPDAIDKDSIKKLQAMASHYIDSIEQKSLTDINHVINANYNNLEVKAKLSGQKVEDLIRTEAGEEILKNINTELKDKKEKMETAVTALVNNELHTAQNYGALDGIISVSNSIGIEDPSIIKIGVLDENRCKYCWKLWTLEDKITPKVYKLSELTGSPGHWKNPTASVSPTHVNCRDILVAIFPGFGFKEGKLAYIGKDHNEYEHQKKSSS